MKPPSTQYQPGKRRGTQAAHDLAEAYRALANGNPTSADCERIIADLAEFSGFYTVSGPADADAWVRFREGQRSVFGRMLNFMRLTDTERRDLEVAARYEAITSLQEGNS